eukprot:5757529-Pyramimonas_sp.AAC.1
MAEGLLVNTAPSGLEVCLEGHLPLTSGDVASLEGLIVRKCRANLGGAATWDNDMQHLTAMNGLDALNQVPIRTLVRRAAHHEEAPWLPMGCRSSHPRGAPHMVKCKCFERRPLTGARNAMNSRRAFKWKNWQGLDGETARNIPRSTAPRGAATWAQERWGRPLGQRFGESPRPGARRRRRREDALARHDLCRE